MTLTTLPPAEPSAIHERDYWFIQSELYDDMGIEPDEIDEVIAEHQAKDLDLIIQHLPGMVAEDLY